MANRDDPDFVSWSQKYTVDVLYKKYREFITRYQAWLIIKFAQEYMQAQFIKGNDFNIPKFGTFSPRALSRYFRKEYYLLKVIYFKPDFHFLTLLKERQRKNF